MINIQTKLSDILDLSNIKVWTEGSRNGYASEGDVWFYDNALWIYSHWAACYLGVYNPQEIAEGCEAFGPSDHWDKLDLSPVIDLLVEHRLRLRIDDEA